MNETEQEKSRDLLTASRSACLLKCQRQHFWRYEVGLKPLQSAHALRFGSAWHTAMEARWQGKEYQEALEIALGSAESFEAIDAATLAGMLAGYYATYSGERECVKSLYPEQEFRFPLPGSRTFDAAGKIDGLGVLVDEALALVEHKTTIEDIGPDADYWNVLRFNSQVYQYVGAARMYNWNVEKVIYDVVRKPAIRPLSNVPKLDEAGLKIVHGPDGQRVIKKDGSPKQTADKEKGETVAGAPETAEQFGDRLAADTQERPEFYFQRREVPILEDDMEQFEIQRLEVGRLILHLRAASRKAKRPEYAWARNCGPMTCRSCEFSGPCLQNIPIDPANPPAGFVVGEKFSELSNVAV